MQVVSGEKSRRRNVPFSATVVTVLIDILARSRFTSPDDLVFASRNGTPLNENNLMRRVLKAAAREHGMPWLSRHCFRRTHATLGEPTGMTLSDRTAQMGHATGQMTMH